MAADRLELIRACRGNLGYGMRIAILGLTATSYGSLTYLKNLLPQLAQLDQSNQYFVYLPPGSAQDLDVRQPNFRIIRSRAVPCSGVWRGLWEQLILPWVLWLNRIDVVYTTHKPRHSPLADPEHHRGPEC